MPNLQFNYKKVSFTQSSKYKHKCQYVNYDDFYNTYLLKNSKTPTPITIKYIQSHAVNGHW